MFSVRRVLLPFALGAALGAGPAVAAPAMARPWDDDPNRGRQVHLSASLSGRGVVGEDRDRNGVGRVELRIRSFTGEVCYNFRVRRVDDPMRISVYVGGRNNPNDRDTDVKVGLANHGSRGEGCRKISPRVAQAIASWPSRYNVQVDGDDGAIRGQLRYDRRR